MKRLDAGAAVECSLNDTEFRKRRTLARRTLIPKITASERTQYGLILTFPADASLRADLEEFVNLEQQCCGFLEFTISTDAAEPNSAIELSIESRPEAAATIEIFADVVPGLV